MSENAKKSPLSSGSSGSSTGSTNNCAGVAITGGSNGSSTSGTTSSSSSNSTSTSSSSSRVSTSSSSSSANFNSSSKRDRTQRKMFLEDFWDCSICTYRNKAEAFKCSICDARKGTSTRKPRINPQQLVVAQQVQAAVAPKCSKPKQRKDEKDHPRSKAGSAKLKNIDRNDDIQTAITVNGITVVITEFKMKSSSGRKRTISENSNGSSDGGGGTAQQSDDDYEPPAGHSLSIAEKSSP